MPSFSLLPFSADKSPSPLVSSLSFEATADAFAFHKTMPGYKPTELVPLPGLASSLGLGSVWLKDESSRFSLGAFKVLGAGYAIARQLLLRNKDRAFTFQALAGKEGQEQLTFVTASDGNHGKAVAWACRELGHKAVVLLPKGNAAIHKEWIESQGAKAFVTDENYDRTVLLAKKKSEEEGSILMQDTSWPGYEEIPLQIMHGYCTIVHEIVQSLAEDKPTHVFLQAGVGSFASAMAACLASVYPDIKIVVVEPEQVHCLYMTALYNDGMLHDVGRPKETRITSLFCGCPSWQAWEILRRTASGFISCSDCEAALGIRTLAHPAAGDAVVRAGLAGALTTGVLKALCTDKDKTFIREKLELDASSRVLLVSTEGAVDKAAYEQALSGQF